MGSMLLQNRGQSVNGSYRHDFILYSVFGKSNAYRLDVLNYKTNKNEEYE